jgi:transcriptional regulator of acetoin/glycerol metabolism
LRGPFHAAPSARSSLSARPIAAGLQLGPAQDELIDRSHERCVARGLSRIEPPAHAALARADLLLRRERNLKLHLHAAPVMELLHEQIAGTRSMVVLTDATGTVLASIGDGEFLERASRVALAPGADWSEAAKGTNAVGTALMSEQPTLVHADEHFLHANHFLTCSAAPILDPRGSILGVLDVSGDHRSYHPHTMGLVKMSARMIENHCLTDDCHHAMRLHFHRRIEYIGTLMEGILAVDPDGRIVGANRGALEQLGRSGAALRQHSLNSLFGTGCAPLVDHFRSPLATPLPLRTAQGECFQVHARVNWPVWSALALSPTHAASTTPPAAEATQAPHPGVVHRPPGSDPGPRGTLQDVEQAAIRRALEQSGGNVAAAARQLGISRNTIYRRLQARAGH